MRTQLYTWNDFLLSSHEAMSAWSSFVVAQLVNHWWEFATIDAWFMARVLILLLGRLQSHYTQLELVRFSIHSHWIGQTIKPDEIRQYVRYSVSDLKSISVEWRALNESNAGNNNQQSHTENKTRNRNHLLPCFMAIVLDSFFFSFFFLSLLFASSGTFLLE